MRAATFFDGDEWRDGVVSVVDGRVLLRESSPSDRFPRLSGVVTGGFTDHHVHLQLIDASRLHRSRLSRVVDLGGNPTALQQTPAHNSGISTSHPGGLGRQDQFEADVPELWTGLEGHPVRTEFAGAFLTPVGGYPSDRQWAPIGSVREIADAAAARIAVTEMADAGASCIKIASNRSAGPVFSDHLFRTIVELARTHNLPVVAHAEGEGEAQRAVHLGAAMLAHAPFSERLDDEEIAVQAQKATWISTLSIHEGPERALALDNVRRFHSAGGTVLYGTDMGNGATPVDLSEDEVSALRDAGLDKASLWRSLAPTDPRDPSCTVFYIPDSSSATANPVDARPLIPADLKV